MPAQKHHENDGVCYWCGTPVPGARCCDDPICATVHEACRVPTWSGKLRLNEVAKLKYVALVLSRIAQPIYRCDWRTRRKFLQRARSLVEEAHTLGRQRPSKSLDAGSTPAGHAT